MAQLTSNCIKGPVPNNTRRTIVSGKAILPCNLRYFCGNNASKRLNAFFPYTVVSFSQMLKVEMFPRLFA